MAPWSEKLASPSGEEPGDGGHAGCSRPRAHPSCSGWRVDPHRRRVGVLAGDALVHLEEVAVPGLDGVSAVAGDGVGEVEVDAVLERADAAALRRPRSWRCGRRRRGGPGCRRPGTSPRGSSSGRPRGCRRRARVSSGLRGTQIRPSLRSDSDISVSFDWNSSAGRDAGGVDLGVARVGEQRTLAVGPPGGGGVAGHGVGATGRTRCRSRRWPAPRRGRCGGDLAGDRGRGRRCRRPRRPCTTRSSISVWVWSLTVARARPGASSCLVGAEQELLAGLAAGVEGAGDLGAAEGAVVEQAAVLAGEGHALGHALVDDVDRDLGQAVDVGLAAAVVAALDGVVEQPVDAVAVVLVVLGGVDAALGGDQWARRGESWKVKTLTL